MCSFFFECVQTDDWAQWAGAARGAEASAISKIIILSAEEQETWQCGSEDQGVLRPISSRETSDNTAAAKCGWRRERGRTRRRATGKLKMTPQRLEVESCTTKCCTATCPQKTTNSSPGSPQAAQICAELQGHKMWLTTKATCTLL